MSNICWCLIAIICPHSSYLIQMSLFIGERCMYKDTPSQFEHIWFIIHNRLSQHFSNSYHSCSTATLVSSILNFSCMESEGELDQISSLTWGTDIYAGKLFLPKYPSAILLNLSHYFHLTLSTYCTQILILH